MKAFENMPGRYDLGMRLITFGRLDHLHRRIAEAIPSEGDVLDIGCGTGKLLSMLVGRGARVTAIDKSPEMVALSSKRTTDEGLCKSVKIDQRTVMEADRLFEDSQFDAVILSLVMSELNPDEGQWVLKQCHRVLKQSGVLLLADEFVPTSFFNRIAFFALRFPLHLTAYLYTQIKGLFTPNAWWKVYYTIVELPLMLISFFVSEPMTRPLGELKRILPPGLKITEVIDFGVAGSIRLLKIEKVQG
jgi:demethylmenaquinone methyltransferase/2-methoxy-6-polyprenyl-1,4-benzoquinol methylase